MEFKASFFQLQLDFAAEVAKAKELEFSQALLDYSPIFRLIGAEIPLWDTYLAGLPHAEEVSIYTENFVRKYRFKPKRAAFGCFAYEIEEDKTQLRLHFENIEGQGALSQARIPARQAEIKALLIDALLNYPQLVHIRGGSWLYNLAAYRRLFPPVFFAETYIQTEEFQFLALWGQCLLGTGEANPQASAYLREKSLGLRSEVDLQTCFQYQVLGMLGEISSFRQFYDC